MRSINNPPRVTVPSHTLPIRKPPNIGAGIATATAAGTIDAVLVRLALIFLQLAVSFIASSDQLSALAGVQFRVAMEARVYWCGGVGCEVGDGVVDGGEIDLLVV